MRNYKKIIYFVLVCLLFYPSFNFFRTIFKNITRDKKRWNETITILADNLSAILELPLGINTNSVAVPTDLWFEGFDNETGLTFDGRLIVPNIIHYVRFNQSEFSFIDYVCLRSVYLAQKPDRIYLHTNQKEQNFTGIYWKWIRESERDLYRRIVVQPMQLPKEIFGQKLNDNGWGLYHGSDIARIQIMMKYGGIYLDNDVYVVSNLDVYRKYEISMGWDEGDFVGSQVIVAHRQARYLPLWLSCYQKYNANLWYYNAGERPTVEILYKQPELLHRVKRRFGVSPLMHELYNSKDWPLWSQNYDTIHLLMNHRYYLDPHFKEYDDFNERSIQHYPYMFGKLVRLVVPADKLLNPS